MAQKFRRGNIKGENNMAKRKTSRAAQRAKFKRAAKKCKGKKIKAFRLCMRRELRKKR